MKRQPMVSPIGCPPMPYWLFMQLKRIGRPPPSAGSQSVLYWSIEAKVIPSQTGPQPNDASPMLHTTMPGLRLTRLKSAAPGAIEPEPPTMALFG